MRVLRAVLGWANEETHGGNSLRLYALDKGNSPRWAPDGGRTIERAIIEKDGDGLAEGCRYMVILLGDRFFSDNPLPYLVDCNPKMLRETLCEAQAAIAATMEVTGNDQDRIHIGRLQDLIDACDMHRPIGPDGKHGNRHTETCGCES